MFIRHAKYLNDRYGEVMYYVDGSYIRRAKYLNDRYGEVMYYID